MLYKCFISIRITIIDQNVPILFPLESGYSNEICFSKRDYISVFPTTSGTGYASLAIEQLYWSMQDYGKLQHVKSNFFSSSVWKKKWYEAFAHPIGVQTWPDKNMTSIKCKEQLIMFSKSPQIQLISSKWLFSGRLNHGSLVLDLCSNSFFSLNQHTQSYQELCKTVDLTL